MKQSRRYKYFNRCRCVQMWFDNLVARLISVEQLKSWACSCCIHRFDKHMMNCFECCPGQRAIVKSKYKESDFIQTAPEGQNFGKHWAYKYRVLGRNGFPTHHTNNYEDARGWFRRCVERWIEKDNP